MHKGPSTKYVTPKRPYLNPHPPLYSKVRCSLTPNPPMSKRILITPFQNIMNVKNTRIWRELILIKIIAGIDSTIFFVLICYLFLLIPLILRLHCLWYIFEPILKEVTTGTIFFKSLHTLLPQPPIYPCIQKYNFGGIPTHLLKRTLWMPPNVKMLQSTVFTVELCLEKVTVHSAVGVTNFWKMKTVSLHKKHIWAILSIMHNQYKNMFLTIS